MKRITALLLTITLLTACGGGLDGKKLADENCDCQMKANAMDSKDPKRAEANIAEAYPITIVLFFRLRKSLAPFRLSLMY